MKKISTKNVMALSLAAILSSGCFVACGGPTGEEPIDKSKYQLTVGVYNGGFGGIWADQLAIEFEKEFENLELGDGRKGVQVTVDDENKAGFDTATLTANLGSGVYDYDVVHSPAGIDSFFDLDENVVADMTDVYTEKVYDSNGNYVGKEAGTLSVLDRLDDYYIDTYNFGTEENPKYYCLPYEDTYKGFVYDHDLFEEMGWLNYSGYEGTPKTVNEFYDLLLKIKKAGMIAFTSSMGDAGFYWVPFQYGFLAQYEGEENAWLNLSLNGDYTFKAGKLTSDILSQLDSDMYVENEDGSITVHVTPENGWILREQQGKEELAKFMSTIMTPDYYDPASKMTGASINSMHEQFVFSVNPGETRIAMIFEGEWWEKESKGYFDELAKRPTTEKYSFGKRDLRYMPIPQVEGGVNEGYTMLSLQASASFINNYAVKDDIYRETLSKLWMQYMHARRGCALYSIYAGGVLAMDYKMTAEEQALCTPFVKSTYKMKKESDVKTLRVGLMNDDRIADYTLKTNLRMTGYGFLMNSTFKGKGEQNVALYFYKNPSATVQDWVKGYKERLTKDLWMTAYNTYLSQSK